MNHLKRKALITFVLMAVLTGIATYSLYSLGYRQTIQINQKQGQYKASCIVDLLNDFAENANAAADQYMEKLSGKMSLMADALRYVIADSSLTEPRTLRNGMVVLRDGDSVILPEELEEGFFASDEDPFEGFFENDDLMTSAQIWPQDGTQDPVQVYLYGEQIEGDWYYIHYFPESEYVDYYESYTDFHDLIPVAEELYGNAILLIDDSTDDLLLQNESTVFPDAVSAADIGLTADMIEHETPFLAAPDGESYSCTYFKDSYDLLIVIMNPFGAKTKQEVFVTSLVIGIMLMFFIPLIVWHIETQRFVRDRIIPAYLEKRYHPRRMRSLTILIGLIGMLVVFAFSSLIRSISILRDYTTENTKTLEILYDRIEKTRQKAEENVSQNDAQWMLELSRYLADLILDYPQLLDQELLQYFTFDINAEYIMVFDQDGNETLSSNDYSAFSLYSFKGMTGTDFQLLLNGVSEIISDPISKSSAGDNVQFAGVTLSSGDSSEKNGGLIIAFPLQDMAKETAEHRISGMLYSLVPTGSLFLAFDEESRKVLYSSDQDMTGLTSEDLDMSEDDMRDSFMDFLHINGVSYYGCSMKKENLINFYNVPTQSMFTDVISYGVYTVIIFAAVYGLLSLILLMGYTASVFREWEVIGEPTSDMTATELLTADGRRRRSIDPSRRWAFSYTKWDGLFPDQKVRLVLTIIAITVLTGSMAILSDMNQTSGNTNLIYFVMDGKWSRGFNLFALFAILIMVAMLVTFVIATRIFLSFICRYMGTKGETVCRLIYNLIQYTMVFIAFYHGFGYLGFDTTTIIASAGLISLALSLGARDIVADFLSGLTIVFEGAFQVGDIIDIEGYRGTVQEIGVRTTKILGRGDNIKIVTNSTIKNVVNMTRLNSWYALELTIMSTESLPELEDILNRELPKIGAKNKMIISGPFYRGVTGFTNDTMTISITTECKEQNFSSVQRYVNKEVRNLLGREQIPMK